MLAGPNPPAGAAGGGARRPPEPPAREGNWVNLSLRHLSHHHEPVDVQHGKAGGGPVTYVLHRCAACGDVISEELAGTWGIDQVRGITPPGAFGGPAAPR
jgi:hypothetical protein